VYDGDNAIEELSATGTSTARYTQGLGIDEPLEVFESNASYYYHADGLGSVTELTKKNASTVNTYFYDTFGDDSPASSETVANPFHYTARERDSETKLYYYRARYYDPLFGRFLSEDPLRFQGGMNLYAYARNRPTSLVDPTGRVACYPVCFCRYESFFRRVPYVHRQLPFRQGPCSLFGFWWQSQYDPLNCANVGGNAWCVCGSPAHPFECFYINPTPARTCPSEQPGQGGVVG